MWTANALSEVTHAGVDGHHAAVGGRPVSLLPATADFAGAVLSLCAGSRGYSHRVVARVVTAVGAGKPLPARLGLALPMPVGYRVAWDLVELHDLGSGPAFEDF
jgi:hypothetical protein